MLKARVVLPCAVSAVNLCLLQTFTVDTNDEINNLDECFAK